MLAAMAGLAYTAPRNAALRAPAALALQPGGTRGTLRLNFSHAGSFVIAQIADVHLGEGEKDVRSLETVRSLLDTEVVHLAVLSGDQLTGHDIKDGAASLWQQLTEELILRRIPHTAVLGNHDAEPYLDPATDNLTATAYHLIQDSPGANTSRLELISMDSQLNLSLSQVGSAALLPAVSSFVVDVLPQSGNQPLLSLFHLDTGGGGMVQNVLPAQLAWLEAELARHTSEFPSTPVLVFAHIPMRAYASAWERGDCFGVKEDFISPDLNGLGDETVTRIIAETPQVKAVFVGHDHCNDFCCKSEQGAYLCYGRHSGAGGRQCAGYSLGMRFIKFDVLGNRSWQLSTHVRLTNGTISQDGLLAES